MIALKAGKVCSGSSCLRNGCTFDVRQCACTINIRLTHTEQIQVWPIEQQNAFCHRNAIQFNEIGRILPPNVALWQEKYILTAG
jgi:hypothetical protein